MNNVKVKLAFIILLITLGTIYEGCSNKYKGKVNLKELGQLLVNKTDREVVKLLGKPTERYKRESGDKFFFYEKYCVDNDGTFQDIMIIFDSQTKRTTDIGFTRSNNGKSDMQLFEPGWIKF